MRLDWIEYDEVPVIDTDEDKSAMEIIAPGLLEGRVVLEQVNYTKKRIGFFSWLQNTWEKDEIFNDDNRVAVWKKKGSNINTIPDQQKRLHVVQ